MRHAKLLLLVVVCWGRMTAGGPSVYQRDVSEHCRRRALPSVFLGKRVLETNAQMMQLSRLELPYSCFIAVRAETGNHIILVIQLQSDDSLVTSCTGEGDQLLVYELGETFGGYWGQIPLDYIRHPTTEGQETSRNYYTLKGTHKTVTSTTSTEPTTPERSTAEQLSGNVEASPAVWTDVVPLLNLSWHLVPSGTAVQHRINSDDAFDVLYDVTPVRGVEYETSIIPLMQFSISALKDDRRKGDGSPPFSDLLYRSDGMFTPETSLWPHNFINMRKIDVTKRKNYFRTITGLYGMKSTTHANPPHRSRIVSNTVANRFQYNQNQLSSNDLLTESPQDSWLHVLDLMNVLKNRTNTFHLRPIETNDTQSKLLQEISQVDSKSGTEAAQTTRVIFNDTVSNSIQTVTTEFSSSEHTTSLKAITGALVGHESWDNVVNVAPKMALVLNRTTESSNNSFKRMNTSFSSSKLTIRRKKRDVQSINVYKSKPHGMIQRLAKTTESAVRYSKIDMYGFSPIVEPQDDEMYGRANLRYMHGFIGPPLFNLCINRKDEPKKRQVLLFKTSRILISISNFTIKRMMIVTTAARTLDSVSERCPAHHLECQVSGARVCVDSSSACDGVPNCGAYDIYDEDRLICGAGRQFELKIYLAAFTFLAVLMTVCYSIHYWLKRCVPQVSEAFFIYNNSAENILYLDSIMKAPTETDDLSKLIYQGPILEDDYLQQSTDRRSTLRKLIDRISFCFQRKQVVVRDTEKRESRFEPRRMYSFTELELNKFTFKITTDTSVQTGESLELQTYIQEQKARMSSTSMPQDLTVGRDAETIQGGDTQVKMSKMTVVVESRKDLKLLKFLRQTRGSMQESPGTSGAEGAGKAIVALRTSEEKVLRNLLYDVPGTGKECFSSLAVAYDPNDIAALPRPQAAAPALSTSGIQKRLRFEETATVIPSPNYETNDPSQSKQSLVPASPSLGPSDEGPGMDFMRFWNIKPKKPKNKGHISLREK